MKLKRVSLFFLCVVVLWFSSARAWAGQDASTARPNIVLIMVDDLGIGELGCYGSKSIKTPNIDALAKSGARFTCCYSGSIVCAPARCSLMCGQHASQCSIRANTGGVPLPDADVTMAEMLKTAGYRTGGFGKWALGVQSSQGDPQKQGFDEFFGFYHQTHAHNHYPEYLLHNGDAVELPGNIGTHFGADVTFLPDLNSESGKPLQYAPYLLVERAKEFIRQKSQAPFFCYLPLTLPHGNFHIPASDPAAKDVLDKPWSDQAKAVAAMMQLVDSQVGELVTLLKELTLLENTIIVFCSDHGPALRFEGELDGAGLYRGRKRSIYEGGIRTPLVISWPSKIGSGFESELPVYLGDLYATFEDIAASAKKRHPATTVDRQHQHSISLLPTLVGQPAQQQRHKFLLWEWSLYNPNSRRWRQRRLAIRHHDWKLLRHSDDQPWELYNISVDPYESSNVVESEPGVAALLEKMLFENLTSPPSQPEAMIDWMKPFPLERLGKGIRLRSASVRSVIDTSVDDYRNIRFDTDAVLLGLNQKVDSDGNLHLNFALELKPKRRNKQFIRIYDSDGKLISHGRFDQPLDAHTNQSKMILDYVAISADELAKAHSVAIGFSDGLRKASRILNGSQAGKFELTIWQR